MLTTTCCITSIKIATKLLPHQIASFLSNQQGSKLTIWLDSNDQNHELHRYSIIASNPSEIFSTYSPAASSLQSKQWPSYTSPLSKPAHASTLTQQQKKMPFLTGAIGLFDYEANNTNLTLPSNKESCSILGIFNWSIVYNHTTEQMWLNYDPSVIELLFINQLLNKLSSIKPNTSLNTAPFRLTKPFKSNFTKPGYQHAFEKIQTYLKNGDCYQVNLAQKFTSQYEGNPLNAYKILRKAQPAPFSVYAKFENKHLLSFSPERFISINEQGEIESRPIKGTIARSEDPKKDQQQQIKLSNSTKDISENLMITDLLRSDLGQSCEPGSIYVYKLFQPESFRSVHHLVSIIKGKILPEKHAIDIFQACFPGGSITGAPKKRAMEIIKEIEPDARQFYCGSVAYFDHRGNMDSNILIRTLICDESETPEISCWGGGGITADSNCQDEYNESIDKIKQLLSKLNDTIN